MIIITVIATLGERTPPTRPNRGKWRDDLLVHCRIDA